MKRALLAIMNSVEAVTPAYSMGVSEAYDRHGDLVVPRVDTVVCAPVVKLLEAIVSTSPQHVDEAIVQSVLLCCCKTAGHVALSDTLLQWASAAVQQYSSSPAIVVAFCGALGHPATFRQWQDVSGVAVVSEVASTMVQSFLAEKQNQSRPWLAQALALRFVQAWLANHAASVPDLLSALARQWLDREGLVGDSQLFSVLKLSQAVASGVQPSAWAPISASVDRTPEWLPCVDSALLSLIELSTRSEEDERDVQSSGSQQVSDFLHRQALLCLLELTQDNEDVPARLVRIPDVNQRLYRMVRSNSSPERIAQQPFDLACCIRVLSRALGADEYLIYFTHSDDYDGPWLQELLLGLLSGDLPVPATWAAAMSSVVCASLTVFAASTSNETSLVTSGAVPVLCSVIQDFIHCQEVVRNACSALETLTFCEEHAAQLAPCVPTMKLVASTFIEDVDITSCALRTLTNVAECCVVEPDEPDASVVVAFVTGMGSLGFALTAARRFPENCDIQASVCGLCRAAVGVMDMRVLLAGVKTWRLLLWALLRPRFPTILTFRTWQTS